MSSSTPGASPEATACSNATIFPNNGECGRTGTMKATSAQQELHHRSVLDSNISSLDAHHAKDQEVSRDVRVPANHSYRVPQLQEPPKRRAALADIRDAAFLQHEGNHLLKAQADPSHLLPLSEHLQKDAGLLSSVPASGNTTSRSFANARDSPVTPWDNYDPSLVAMPVPPLNLHPMASSCIPPMPALQSLGHQQSCTNAIQAASHGGFGVTGSADPSPANSMFGLFSADIMAAGLHIADLDVSNPTETSNLHSPFTRDATRASNAHPHDTKADPSPPQSMLEPTSAETKDAKNEKTASLASQLATPNKLESSSSSSSIGYQDMSLDEPEIWEEVRHTNSFKTQRMNKEVFEETFDGAFDILATLNPDHYRMSWGSRVVSIKTSSITNILLSVKNGMWACPNPVAERIQELWDSRKSENEKVLLLFSVPGSKHFCGLAELLEFNVDETTDFWENGSIYKGAMTLQWLYCKTVPYEEIRNAVGLVFKHESATQMWNGMHYTEPIGREVIKTYVQFPHTENLLAKLKVSPGEGSIAKRSTHRGHYNERGMQHQIVGRKSDTGARNTSQRERGGKFTTPKVLKHSQQRPDNSNSITSLLPMTPSQQMLDDKGESCMHNNGAGTPYLQASTSSSGSDIDQARGNSNWTAFSPSILTPNSFEGNLYKDSSSPTAVPGVDFVREMASNVPVNLLHQKKQDSRVGPPKSTPTIVRGRAVQEVWGWQQEVSTQSQANDAKASTGSVAVAQPFSWPITPRQQSEAKPLSDKEEPAASHSSTRGSSESSCNPGVFNHDNYQSTQSFPSFSQLQNLFSPYSTHSISRSFPVTGAAPVSPHEGIATPPFKTVPSVTHRARFSEAKSSVDLRLSSMVDNLVGSPGRESDKSSTSKSVNSLSDFSGA